MQLSYLTWKGPLIDDPDILSELPPALAGLLLQVNGFVLHYGGLHVRGANIKPEWHSLRTAMRGSLAFSEQYPSVATSDVPFAENALGDQFLLRENQVIFLDGETGDVSAVSDNLAAFFRLVESDPLNTLRLQPLLDFIERSGCIQEGELLAVFPPLCSVQAQQGIAAYQAVPTLEHRKYLSELAAKIRLLSPGDTFDFVVQE
jgi:hypothetical protein